MSQKSAALARHATGSGSKGTALLWAYSGHDTKRLGADSKTVQAHLSRNPITMALDIYSAAVERTMEQRPILSAARWLKTRAKAQSLVTECPTLAESPLDNQRLRQNGRAIPSFAYFTLGSTSSSLKAYSPKLIGAQSAECGGCATPPNFDWS